jgi:hypothetical protein
MAGDFAERAGRLLRSVLQEGETLQGVIAATHQKTFSGSLFAIGVTDRRLLLQPLDRHLQAKGELRSISPETLQGADLEGAGGDWWTAPAAILDMSALAVTFRTNDGEKLKLLMMKGTGVFGGLGGEESQRDGVMALAGWLQRTLGGR